MLKIFSASMLAGRDRLTRMSPMSVKQLPKMQLEVQSMRAIQVKIEDKLSPTSEIQEPLQLEIQVARQAMWVLLEPMGNQY